MAKAGLAWLELPLPDSYPPRLHVEAPAGPPARGLQGQPKSPNGRTATALSNPHRSRTWPQGTHLEAMANLAGTPPPAVRKARPGCRLTLPSFGEHALSRKRTAPAPALPFLACTTCDIPLSSHCRPALPLQVGATRAAPSVTFTVPSVVPGTVSAGTERGLDMC